MVALKTEHGGDHDNEAQQGRYRYLKTLKFWVDKALPLLTALLALVAGALTVIGVDATSDKDNLKDSLSAVQGRFANLQDEHAELVESHSALTADVEILEDERDFYRELACQPRVEGWTDSGTITGHATCTFNEPDSSPPTTAGPTTTAGPN